MARQGHSTRQTSFVSPASSAAVRSVHARAAGPRTFASPTPAPPRFGRSGSHGFSTTMRSQCADPLGADPDGTALEDVRDAVRDGVLDDAAAAAAAARGSRAASPALSSARSRSPKRTRSIARKRSTSASSRSTRDPLLAAERERLAQEVRRAAGTSAAPRRIRRRQRADRVQAVEEKVRIDLRAQRAQLRFAREHLDLEAAALARPARRRTPQAGS